MINILQGLYSFLFPSLKTFVDTEEYERFTVAILSLCAFVHEPPLRKVETVQINRMLGKAEFKHYIIYSPEVSGYFQGSICTMRRLRY